MAITFFDAIYVLPITCFLINLDFGIIYTYICKNFWKETHGSKLYYR